MIQEVGANGEKALCPGEKSSYVKESLKNCLLTQVASLRSCTCRFSPPGNQFQRLLAKVLLRGLKAFDRKYLVLLGGLALLAVGIYSLADVGTGARCE
jgi:hypothetical protein